MANLKNRTSIKTIVIWMIFFFPVGIYFWHKRLTEDKTEMLKNSKYAIAIGWGLVIFGVMGAYLELTGQATPNANGESDIVTGIIVAIGFLFGGFITIKRSKYMRIIGEKYKKYCALVKGQEKSIEGISKIMMLPQGEVIKDLQDMIDDGFFKGAHIDRSIMEIIVPYSHTGQYKVDNYGVHYKSSSHEDSHSQSKAKRRIIKCPNCGAPCEVIEHEISKCEFCSSKLNYDDEVMSYGK